MALSLAKAEFIGTLLETICYGMYFVISLELFRLLYLRLQAGRRTLYLLITAVIIFSLITVHLAMEIDRIIRGFTNHMDVANAPVTFYSTLSVPSRTGKTAIYMTLTIVCDTLFVYRVFVVYQRKYTLIILPSMLFLADLALAIWSIWSITQVTNGNFHAVQAANKRFNYFYALTLTLNVICTVMISWRIWAIHKSVSKPAVAGVRFMGIMAVIIESAAVYLCLLIVLITLSALGITVLWILQDPMIPIIGMVFSAVMVRASREYHYDTFMKTDISLPMYRSRDYAHPHRQETVSRTAGDTDTGQTTQVPSLAKKGNLLTFDMSTSRQASYGDVGEKEHQTTQGGDV